MMCHVKTLRIIYCMRTLSRNPEFHRKIVEESLPIIYLYLSWSTSVFSYMSRSRVTAELLREFGVVVFVPYLVKHALLHILQFVLLLLPLLLTFALFVRISPYCFISYHNTFSFSITIHVITLCTSFHTSKSVFLYARTLN